MIFAMQSMLISELAFDSDILDIELQAQFYRRQIYSSAVDDPTIKLTKILNVINSTVVKEAAIADLNCSKIQSMLR